MPNTVFKTGAINLGQSVNWAAPLNRGLVAWWKVLPNSVGPTVLRNACGSPTNLTLTNATADIAQVFPTFSHTSPQQIGSNFGSVSISTVSVGQFGYLSSTLGITAYPFTLEVRVRFISTANQVLLGIIDSAASDKYCNIEVRGGVASIVGRNTSFTNAAGSTALNTTDWWTITGVFASTTSRKIFVNGVLEGTGATSVTFPGTANEVLLGRLRDVTPSDYMQAYLSEASVFNRALSDSDVLQRYNASRTGYINELNRISRPIGVKAAAAAASAGRFFGAGNYSVGA